MIKMTLTGSNPVPIWVNPQHFCEAIEQSDHTTNVRLMNGNQYQVQESAQMINDQMVAWQHRMVGFKL